MSISKIVSQGSNFHPEVAGEKLAHAATGPFGDAVAGLLRAVKRPVSAVLRWIDRVDAGDPVPPGTVHLEPVPQDTSNAPEIMSIEKPLTPPTNAAATVAFEHAGDTDEPQSDQVALEKLEDQEDEGQTKW